MWGDASLISHKDGVSRLREPQVERADVGTAASSCVMCAICGRLEHVSEVAREAARRDERGQHNHVRPVCVWSPVVAWSGVGEGEAGCEPVEPGPASS